MQHEAFVHLKKKIDKSDSMRVKKFVFTGDPANAEAKAQEF